MLLFLSSLSVSCTAYFHQVFIEVICPCRSPENATIKQKMVYTTSKDALKKCLRGIGTEVQANDYGDLAWTSVLEKLLRGEVAH